MTELEKTFEFLEKRDEIIKSLKNQIENLECEKDAAKVVYCNNHSRYKVGQVVKYRHVKNLGSLTSPNWDVKILKVVVTQVNVSIYEINGVTKSRFYYNINTIKKDNAVFSYRIERGVCEDELNDYQAE